MIPRKFRVYLRMEIFYPVQRGSAIWNSSRLTGLATDVARRTFMFILRLGLWSRSFTPVVTSCVGYCNVFKMQVPLKNIWKLIQNVVA